MSLVKNIVLITPSWPTGSLANGIVTYTENMYNGFKQNDDNCFVLTWKGGDKSNPNIYSINQKGEWSLTSKIGMKLSCLVGLKSGRKKKSAKQIADTLSR